MVLTEHFSENVSTFYSFKVFYVANFTIMKEDHSLSRKNIVLSHGKMLFVIQVAEEVKRSETFTVNVMMRKIKFLKTRCRMELPEGNL